ncbi:MAG TPA: signal peptidase II [Acidimicrobiales bacterium]|nr:signal peptidase II [Acidimicrobiales bacterium]
MQERGAVAALTPARHRAGRWSRGQLLTGALIGVLVVVADQLSKSLEQNALAGGPSHVLGPLDLELTYNSGAAFGVGRGLAPVLIVAGVALVLVVFYGRTVRGRSGAVAAGLLLGGALSNLGDRLFRGHGGAVIDWIHLSHWPTFNVADSCVVVGVGLLLLANLRSPDGATAPAGG